MQFKALSEAKVNFEFEFLSRIVDQVLPLKSGLLRLWGLGHFRMSGAVKL